MVKNPAWKLKLRPEGRISSANFSWTETELADPGPDQLLIKVQYLSLDPTNRIWMSDTPQYMEPVRVGDVMRGLGIGRVEKSRSPLFKEGDLVSGLLGWQKYCLAGAREVSKLPDLDVPLDAHMGPLGMTGWTAYFGLLDIGQPKPGETVVVSAAAGAVGSIVGQIAKIKGARVVGIAGAADKCAWLKSELQFDEVINYKEEDVGAGLDRTCPRGIDVYFENVGGETLDAVLKRLNLFARIPLCGLISTYNSEGPVPGPSEFAQILMKRAKIQGFIVSDYSKRVPEAVAELAQWLKAGKIKYRSTVVKGLEKAPDALNMLFKGENTGKLFLEV